MPDVVIEIGCMDFRLNGVYRSGNDVIHLRNAGGSVAGFETTLRQLLADPNVKEMAILDHNGRCGGMVTTETMLHTQPGKNELGITEESYFALENTLVNPFRAQGLESAPLNELEKQNPRIQRSIAERILQDIGRTDVKVTPRLVDVPTGLHADTVTVALGTSGKSYDELAKIVDVSPSGTYFIQAISPNDVRKDLELAVTVMGKRDIRFLVLDKETQQSAEALVRSLAAERYMVGIEPRVFTAFKERIVR